MAAKIEHSLTPHYDNVWSVHNYIDISLLTTLKLHATDATTSNNVEQCCELLANKVTYVCRGLSDTRNSEGCSTPYEFLVIHLWLKILAFCPAQPKWNQKLQCLLLRESNNPIIFIWEFPGPSNEQDWDDEHNCLMGYYNNIPNNIQSHLKDIDKILNSTRKITIVGTKIGSFSTNDYYVVSSSDCFFYFFSLSTLYWK